MGRLGIIIWVKNFWFWIQVAVLGLKELFIVISLLVSGFVLVFGSWWFSVDYLYTLDLIEKDNLLVPYF